MKRSLRASVAVLAPIGLLLAACSSPAATDTSSTSSASSSAEGSGAGDGAVNIVASTNVYGDIAESIAGDAAEVTSIITSPAQDPHSYEASAQDRLAIENADIVVFNGSGYDPFIETMIEASGRTDLVIVDASEASGLLPAEEGAAEGEAAPTESAEAPAEGEAAEEGDAHAGEAPGAHGPEGFNEHVWYSLHGVESVADAIAEAIGEVDSAQATAATEGAEAFKEQIATLETRAGEVRTAAEGQGVAITEPVPVYLLDEVGLVNRTPDEFSEAIEEGTDVAPAVLQETLAVLTPEQIAFVAYNEQTEGPETEQLRTAAEAANIPVVSFTETLPDGQGYIEWMTANLDNIEQVVGQ